MSDRFDDVAPWGDLVHAYGTATALHATLERVASPSPATAARALDDLFGSICHQGTVYSATAPAVPILYDLASDPRVHHRPRILELLSDIARALPDIEEHHEDEYPEGVHTDLVRWAHEARTAVETGLPTLTALLDDEDTDVRAAAPFVLADFPDHDPIPLLREKYTAENHPGVAASIVLAIGDVSFDRTAPPLAWLTARTQDARREVRAAAATALLWCGADDLDDTLLQALADEIQAPVSTLDDQLWVLDGGRQAFLTAALDDHPAPQIQLARTALAIPTPATVARAGHIMRTWRAAPAALLPSLAALLTTEAAADAAWEIKQGGPDIALITDAIPPLLDHPHDLVAGSALEALARAGDARAVPALAAELAELRRSFSPAPAIAGLRDHADALLPDVREFLHNPKKGTALTGNLLSCVLDGLASWGDLALPLLPEIISLLERRKAVPAAARTLAALGPAATEAVPILRRYLGRKHGRVTSENAAWAIWHITNDATTPLRFLTPTLRRGLDDESTEHLFALAEAAAPAVPLLHDPASAAAVLHRATNDTDRYLPHLLDAAAPTPSGILAIRRLSTIGSPAAAPAIPTIREIAESPKVQATGPSTNLLTTDRTYQAIAIEALTQIITH
ncbi:hypothetical protein BJF79_01040 [Actinomadura sp. CNU-125]|uniref:HEAT repeat domain-containing protein n=1 Tax=Actinomadura sp. CNU-125 TaxID=1904961 RepID=UPI00095F6E5D|nr:HEAT repeat domain-containing protein [Actinomadura sp. CNU-125]OLT27245.1 hypothetical protein BJF79_01040 [Actinomadura sp. CNU-125]